MRYLSQSLTSLQDFRQMLGHWDDRPSNQAYYIEDCQIFRLTVSIICQHSCNLSTVLTNSLSSALVETSFLVVELMLNPMPCIPTLTLGGIQQLRGQNFAIFWPPSPLAWTVFIYPECGQKQTFLTPSLPPPSSVHVVIEWLSSHCEFFLSYPSPAHCLLTGQERPY